MAAPIRPASAKVQGREKWVFVPTIANIAAMTVAEATAGTGLDVSCTLFDSFGRPTKSTNAVTKAQRVCDSGLYQQIGNTTYTGGDLRYALDPQAVAATDAKKTWEKFVDGTTGFLVRRLNVAYATDLAAGQFYSAFPVELGPPSEEPEGDGETAEVAGVNTYVVTGPPAYVKAIVA